MLGWIMLGETPIWAAILCLAVEGTVRLLS